MAIPLNAFVYELPRGQVLGLHPECESCRAPIGLVRLPRLPWKDLCSCGQHLQYDRVEWLLAPMVALLAIWHGPGGPVVLYSLHTVVLLTVGMIDFRHRHVYYITTLPPLVAAMFLMPLLTGIHIGFAVAGATLGALVFGGLYIVGRLIWPDRDAMGVGDIQIAALIGAMDGFPRIAVALFLGSSMNALFSIGLLLMRRRGPKDFIPYGTGLCVATYITFFFPP